MGRSHRYYGQNGEDYLLWQLFAHNPDGFYVDVGAFDGVYLSNSYSFEQAGWSGICIEPTPKYFDICKQRRPKAICVNAACVGDDSIETVEFHTEELGLVSGIHPDPNDVGLVNTYQSFGAEFKGFQKVVISARTLNSILQEYLPAGTAIDFVSLDVEGYELDVLRGFNLREYAPRVLVIEANSDAEVSSLVEHLGHYGYRQARKVKWNYFFAWRDDDLKKLHDTPIWCDLEPQTHPLGSPYNLPARKVRTGEGRKQRLKRLVKRFIGR